MATDVTIRPEYIEVALPGAKVPPFVHRHTQVGHDRVVPTRPDPGPAFGGTSPNVIPEEGRA